MSSLDFSSLGWIEMVRQLDDFLSSPRLDPFVSLDAISLPEPRRVTCRELAQTIDAANRSIRATPNNCISLAECRLEEYRMGLNIVMGEVTRIREETPTRWTVDIADHTGVLEQVTYANIVSHTHRCTNGVACHCRS